MRFVAFMKNRFALFLYCTLFPTIVWAQSGSVLAINAGYLNPKDAKGGMLVGLMLGTSVDEAVDIGVGVDFYYKTYSEESRVQGPTQAGGTSEFITTTVDYSRTIIPLNVSINVKLPTSQYFGYNLRGSVGYQFLLSREKNYELDVDKTRKFGGIGWQAAAGLFYHVGTRSTLLADVFFNSCEVSRSLGKTTEGLPVTERVDLSGLGFRVGISLDIK